MRTILWQSFAVANFCALLLSCQCWGQNTTPTTDGLDRYRATRLRDLDKNSRISKAQHEQLWKHNIMLIVNGGAENLRVDAFGVARTAFVDRSSPTLCTVIMERFSDEIVNSELEYSQLTEALLNLKLHVDRELKKSDLSIFHR